MRAVEDIRSIALKARHRCTMLLKVRSSCARVLRLPTVGGSTVPAGVHGPHLTIRFVAIHPPRDDAETPDDGFTIDTAGRRKAASHAHASVESARAWPGRRESRPGRRGYSTGQAAGGEHRSRSRDHEHRDRDRQDLSPHAARTFRVSSLSPGMIKPLAVDALHDATMCRTTEPSTSIERQQQADDAAEEPSARHELIRRDRRPR